jgi:uracil-DNA glycosylase
MAETSSRFPDNLPKEWRGYLAVEKDKEYFRNLTSFLKSEYKIGKTVFPPKERILWALQSVDYSDVKVVILGQDPYHGPDQAVGLSFAVPNTLKQKPPSLKNIFKEIESDLKQKIDPTKSELTNWAKQGVLLLNTVLTVRRSEAFSHRDRGWEPFTDQVIKILNQRKDPVIFILWGAPARKKKALIHQPPH